MTMNDTPDEGSRPDEPPAPPAAPAYPPPSGGLYSQPYGRSGYPPPAHQQASPPQASQPPPSQPQAYQPHQPAQAYQPYQPAPEYQPAQPYPPVSGYPQSYAQPAAPSYQNWAPTGYLPPAYQVVSKTRRFRRKPLILAVVGLVAAVVAGAVTVQQLQASRSPGQVVQRYFAAVSQGRAADALGFAADAPRGAYLTDSVLQRQLAVAKLTKVHVDNTTSQGGQASVDVEYTLVLHNGSRLVHDQIPLVKRGSSWKLQTVAPQVSLGVTSSGGDRVELAGGKLPAGPIYLFPGALPLDTDSSAIDVEGDPNVRIADDNQSVDLTVALTSAAKASLTKALTAALTKCLSGKSNDANCPHVDDDRPVPGSLRGTVPPITSGLSIALDSAGAGEVALTGQVTVKGSWQVWDFNNQAVPKSGTTDLSIHALASLADLDTVFWSAS